MIPFKLVASVGVLVVALVLPGCFGEQNCDVEQNAQGQKAVCNGTSFSYTLQGSRSGTSDQYVWDNKGSTAYVNAVFQGTGRVHVTITDPNGVQVYSKEHSGSGQTASSQATQKGDPGSWTIKIETRSLQGQVVVTVSRDADYRSA